MNNSFFDFTFNQYRDSIYHAMTRTKRYALIACDEYNHYIVDEINDDENKTHKHNIECIMRDYYDNANDDNDLIVNFDNCMYEIQNYYFDYM